jgi:hypothetical protein
VVAWLLQEGADLNARAKDRMTAIMFAARGDYTNTAVLAVRPWATATHGGLTHHLALSRAPHLFPDSSAPPDAPPTTALLSPPPAAADGSSSAAMDAQPLYTPPSHLACITVA